MQKARPTNNGTLVLSIVETANAELRTFSKLQARAEVAYARSHNGSIAVRTSANKKTATAKANATERTRCCSNFPDAQRRKALWQTGQCSRDTDRKCCLRFALSLACLQPSRSRPQLRACPAVRRALAQMDADRHLDFQKVFAPAMHRKPCVHREKTLYVKVRQLLVARRFRGEHFHEHPSVNRGLLRSLHAQQTRSSALNSFISRLLLRVHAAD